MKSELLNLFFPPLCLHCQKIVESKGALFCNECSFFFEPMDVMNRCPYCFSESERKIPCAACKKDKRWNYKMAATVVAKGPCLSLITSIKRMPYLAKTAASLMMLQFNELNWPLPDCIMTTSQKLKNWIFYGREAKDFVSSEFAKLLNVPKKRRGRDKIILVISDTLDYEKDSSEMELILQQYPKKIYFLALGYIDVAKQSDALIDA